jgi:molybdenum cofactor cytidylyltransferase
MSRVQAIVLAGGAGRRFGGGKLLASYRGGELIDGALRAALRAPVEGVTVVTGYDAERVSESIAAFAQKHGEAFSAAPPLSIIHAHDYAQGMAATLKAGIKALDADCDAVFVFLGDMPSIPTGVAGRLVEALGDHAAAAPTHEGRRGHPVLLTRRLFPTLLGLTGDHGARGALDALGEALALVEIRDDGVLFDVDRWSDLAR